jgi:hypothetical protein
MNVQIEVRKTQFRDIANYYSEFLPSLDIFYKIFTLQINHYDSLTILLSSSLCKIIRLSMKVGFSVCGYSCKTIS